MIVYINAVWAKQAVKQHESFWFKYFNKRNHSEQRNLDLKANWVYE